MESIENKPVWRYLGLLVVILALLVAGTWVTVKVTTDHLLYRNATEASRNWAQFLAANVPDLEQIAAGETPSSTSMEFLNATRHSEEVFRYVVFNRYGYSILVADRGKVAPIDLSEFDATAALTIKDGQPHVGAKEGRGPGQPAYYSEAYVPVIVSGRPIAVVAAYVDQTDEQNDFSRTFLLAAAALCGLTALSFGVPAIAWYRRTREKQQADRRITFLAHHDTLTGLANRARLIERLEGALAVLPSIGGNVALYFIDIDHFKQVNDTLGHDGGDFLLSTIGERLRAIVRIEDMVARLGGDEFVVAQTGVAGKPQAEAFAERIAEVLSTPSYFKEQEVRPSFTVGVALAPQDGVTAERLLKSADLALYEGKTAGRNCIRFFTAEMDAALQKRISLERIIRDAVAHEGLVLHYQPVFEMVNRHLVGFEALVRLPAPDGTLIPPDAFLPLAEEMRLIDKIGTWVLGEACRTATSWPDDLTVAVNLSPAQFESGLLVDTVADALKTSGLRPHRLELEILESLLLENTVGRHGDPQAAQGNGRVDRHGRFRHRLFEPELSLEIPLRQDQDRPQFHGELREIGPRCGDGGEDNHRARPRNEHAGDGRGRGDLGPSRLSIRCRCRPGAGLLFRPSVAGVETRQGFPEQVAQRGRTCTGRAGTDRRGDAERAAGLRRRRSRGAAGYRTSARPCPAIR